MPAPASGDQKSATGQVLAERIGTDIGRVVGGTEQLWAGMTLGGRAKQPEEKCRKTPCGKNCRN